MDKFASYFDTESIKGLVNKVTNVVYNFSEYQAKVNEATNNDKWGASSTLMTDISHATSNPTHFGEIMDMIYRKFDERGENWRQCYKALQLLEYLIKNGSERVVDNAKDHIYELKALKNFSYTDEKMKDQGLNVRQRAKEIAELLEDNSKIRDERKKAKENRAKYTSVSSSNSGGSSNGFNGAGGSRYGGFGSESLSSGGFRDTSHSGGFRENTTPSRSGGFKDSGSDSASPKRKEYDPPIEKKIQIVMKGESSSPTSTTKSTPQPNLLDFDDTPQPTNSSSTAVASNNEDDWGDFSGANQSTLVKNLNPLDDFADFQAAIPAVKPQQQQQNGNLNKNTFVVQGQQQNGGFANFNAFPTSSGTKQPPTMMGQTNNNNQFTAFSNSSTTTSNNFGNFSTPPSTQQTNNFGNFTSQSPSINFGNNFSSPTQNFQQQKPTTPSTLGISKPVAATNSDPFSKLVSLDAKSLLGSAKKEETQGPSLNSIHLQQHQQFGFGKQQQGQQQPQQIQQQMQVPQQQQQQHGGAKAGGQQDLLDLL